MEQITTTVILGEESPTDLPKTQSNRLKYSLVTVKIVVDGHPKKLEARFLAKHPENVNPAKIALKKLHQVYGIPDTSATLPNNSEADSAIMRGISVSYHIVNHTVGYTIIVTVAPA